jgi:hypothetical protein
MEEEVDDQLAAEAARRGVSKASLIRDLVRAGFTSPGVDPVDQVIGQGDGEPVDNIDEAVYGG